VRAICARGKFTDGCRGLNGGWEGAGEKEFCPSIYHLGKLKNRLLLGLVIQNSLYNGKISRYAEKVN
jgi:hypothetical protein